MSAPHFTTTLASVFQGLIAGFGVIGNAIVIFVFVMGRDKQDTSSVVYIFNLALSDFMFLLAVPFSISTEIALEWIYGDVMCKMTSIVSYLNFMVSPLFLMVMSVDRCFAVCRAISSSAFRSTRFAVRISIAVWVFGLIVVMAPAMFSQVRGSKCEPVFPGKSLCDSEELDECFSNASSMFPLDSDPEFNNSTTTTSMPHIFNSSRLIVNETGSSPEDDPFDLCLATICPEYDPNQCMHRKSKGFNIWQYFTFVCNFLVPCIVIVTCYATLLLHVYRPSAISQSSSSSGGMKDDRKRRATVVVALLVASYFICFTPFYAWQVALLHGVPVSDTTVCSHVRRLTLTLAYFNSAFNPILYPFIGSQFRSKFKLAMRRLRRKTQNSRLSTRSSYKMSQRCRRAMGNKMKLANQGDNKTVEAKKIEEEKLVQHTNKDDGVLRSASNGQYNHRESSVEEEKLSSQNVDNSPEKSSGCLSCCRSDRYICPECVQPTKTQEQVKLDDVSDDETLLKTGVGDNKLQQTPNEKLKLCRKHRNAEQSTSKLNHGRWRYEPSLRSEFATEATLVQGTTL